jgi:uncharacterized protein YjdB
VVKGETLQFAAAVEGTGEYSEAVVWTIDGQSAAETGISDTGLLSVAADEETETLTVSAASAVDNAKYGRVTVNITGQEPPPPGPSILSVTVSPAGPSVVKGKTFQFAAAVEGTGAYSAAVIWTVEGQTAAGTGISDTGLLSVAADEGAETLTVSAASAVDSAKYGRVTANITGPEPPPPGPSILSVTVSPGNASLAKGETFQFSAAVTGTGAYSAAVAWTIGGKPSAGTTVSADGLLSVAADETAAALTLSAASVSNNAKYGIAAITVTDPPPPSILSVTVSPANPSVAKGGTAQFSAAVTGTGAYSRAVVWTVDGKTAAGTGISAAGLLSVAADETAATLTVTAASTANSAKYGSVTANVVEPAVVQSVTVSPANPSVIKGETRQFSAAVTGTGAYSRSVLWTVEGKTAAGTGISAAGLLSVAADEGAETLTVAATSAVDSSQYGRVTVTITAPEPPPPSILSVTVSPGNASVVKGETRQFSVSVTGTGDYSRAVLWTVEGKTAAGTGISGGLLSVAADETAAALTVTARSAADDTKSGSAQVALITPLPSPTGLKVVPSIKQIYASWNAVPGAASYEIRYAVSPGTLESAAPFAVEPVTNSVIITDLDDRTVYDVWVTAKDAAGNAGVPSAPQTCFRTSAPVNPFWYSGDFDFWDSETDGYEITETTLGYNTMTPWSGSGLIGGFRYMADIRYYIEFDPAEAAAMAPNTQIGKWQESLEGYPAGVFIIEYRDDARPVDSRPGDFFGVYFYGLGAPQTTSEKNSLTVNHVGDRLAYLGNSIGLSEAQGGPKGVTQQWNPETQTLEEAIERFTLENIHKFIAYVATPWYRLKGNYTDNHSSDDNWIKGGTYP